VSRASDPKDPDGRKELEDELDDWLSDRPTTEIPPQEAQSPAGDAPEIELRVEELDGSLGDSTTSGGNAVPRPDVPVRGGQPGGSATSAAGSAVPRPDAATRKGPPGDSASGPRSSGQPKSSEAPPSTPLPGLRESGDPARAIGQVIAGRYRIVGLVARGGMGAVYAGEHLLLKAPVAIKLLGPEAKNLPELVERFRREALVGAHVRHPNIAAATDFGRQPDGSCYLVLEFVEGTTLEAELQGGPMEPGRAVQITIQIAEALSALHDRGVVHRDLKPSNVMLARRGVMAKERDLVKLIDFGLAKLDRSLLADRASVDDEELRLTSAGVVFGTLAYLAPEAALGMQAVDARSDLYALGLVLYRMLAGRHPFTWQGEGELFRKQMQEIPPSLSEVAPRAAISAGLEAIVARLLEKEPGRRPQSAAELLRDLVRLAEPEPPSVAEPAAPAESVALPAIALPRPTRMPTNWPWLAIAAAAAAIGVGVVVLRPSKRAPRLAPVTASASRATPASVGRSAPASARLPSSASAGPVSREREVPAAPPLTGAERKALEARFVSLVNTGKSAAASESLEELARRDPEFLSAKAGKNATIGLVNALSRTNDPRADAAFDLLTRAGPAGLDVLLQIALYQGGSPAHPRAMATLADPRVGADVSPELRVTLELYRAGCESSPDLYQRAAEEGDVRAVRVFLAHRDRCPKSDVRERAFFRLQKRLDAAKGAGRGPD
jgi:eukaryotic-like serine/threonine-protein kinase